MKLAQGILKRWNLEKLKDTDSGKIAPLTYLIDLEYRNYLHLCYYTYQRPLSKSKWLSQEINEAEK